ncbi:MFS transporter [Ideonella sp.]|uniref:MFS transporter n=1 Tax=Ideonella sp. TaxID=1929293 RepID=UPI002B48C70D|nr:MFS transporter [Ideonella sp.]HJV70519.1 MFS transporter [Ideonella sp.]
MTTESATTAADPAHSTSALAPFATPVFRMLWLAWLAANITMWMNDVAAAWLMTTLTTSPVLVAMVQTASTLPVFLLGLPSGALADILDRRRYFAGTQLWVALNAVVLAVLSLADALTAPLLIALTFTNGIGLAMRWPVFAAIVPDIVPRHHMPQALALNGVAMNLSRIVGPVVAGAILAATSSAWVFVLNAALAFGAFVLILRWKSKHKESALPGERFVGAMRVGWQHVMQSPRMRAVLLRIFLFFLQSTALMALLPLVAKSLHGGGPGSFTVLLACLGGGAVTAALLFPRWRARFNRDQFVRYGTLVHAVMSLIVVFSPQVWMALPAMVVAGMAWISTANSLTISAQLALPNWVRARGMSIYQMALMGGSAAGSLLWGQVAGLSNVRTAVIAAAVFGPLALLATRRVSVEGGGDEDLTPASPANLPEVAIEVAPDDGPVMVTVEYHIDPARADDFARVMQVTRRARLRQGALTWALLRDTSVPGRYVEYFVDENWVEHQRRHERFTAADIGLREQRLAFHLGEAPPKVKRYVAERSID